MRRRLDAPGVQGSAERSAAAELLVRKAREELHGEFGAVHPAETIDRLYDKSLAQFGGARVEDYLPALAQRVARERLKALGQIEGRIAHGVPEVVFVGLEGRGRSAMAAGLMEKLAAGRVNVHSAGTSPQLELDANVSDAMAEVGVDLADSYPKPLTDEVLDTATVVITLGRSVGEVVIPASTRHEDWRVGDPVGASLVEARRIRDELEGRVRALLDDLI